MNGGAKAPIAAADADEIDMTYQSTGEFIEVLDAMEWTKSEAVTAATLCVRFNQSHAPYDDPKVRKALQMAAPWPNTTTFARSTLNTLKSPRFPWTLTPPRQ